MLESALSYLFIKMRDCGLKEQWLIDIDEHIKYNSWGYFSGFMDLGLDKNLTTDQRKKNFLGIINNTVEGLKVKENNLHILADLETVLDGENKKRCTTPGSVERDRAFPFFLFAKN